MITRADLCQARGSPPVPLPRRHKPWPRRSDEPIVDGYRLLSRIGSGGTATVFLAKPIADGPPVAVKVINHHGDAGVLDAVAHVCRREGGKYSDTKPCPSRASVCMRHSSGMKSL